MPKALTLKAPDRMGNLLWDDDLGTFQGTDAELIDACADTVQTHPGFPAVEVPARKNAQALIVLLACLGWDCPAELAQDLKKLRARESAMPSGAVA